MKRRRAAILLIGAGVIVVLLGFWLWFFTQSNSQSKTVDEALNQARNYQADGICLTVLTTAVHTATGATYTFGSSCMPDGWKPVSAQ